MDTAPAFCGRDSLDAMSAAFIFERGETFAFDFDGNLSVARVCWAFPNDAVLSTLAGEEAQVGVREVLDEKLTISAALSRANFDYPLHGFSPVRTIPTIPIYT